MWIVSKPFVIAGGGGAVLAISTSGEAGLSPTRSLLGLAMPSGLLFGGGRRPCDRQAGPAAWQTESDWEAGLLGAVLAVHGTDHESSWYCNPA